MSAMLKMLADMVLKDLDPKIKELLTPDNIQSVVSSVSETLQGYQKRVENMEEAQGQILNALEQLNKGSTNDGSKHKRISGEPVRAALAGTAHGNSATSTSGITERTGTRS